jgi:hypothetical protein
MRRLGAVVGLSVLLPVGLFLAMLETRPAVTDIRAPDASDVKAVEALARDWRTRLRAGDFTTVLSATGEDIEAIMAAAHRTVPVLRTNGTLEETGLALTASVTVATPLGDLFLNARARLLSGYGPVRLAEVRLGRLPLPGSMIPEGVKLAGNLILGESLASDLIESVVSVQVDPDAQRGGLIRVRLDHAPDLDGSVDRMTALLGKAGRFAVGDRLGARMAAHLNRMERVTAALPADASGAAWVGAAFAAAELKSEEPDAAAIENMAVLLALGTLLGDRKTTAVMAALAETPPPERRAFWPTLGGREDLMRHFGLSAALEALSVAQLAVAAGEMKELLDSFGGRSGFSFVDLAANRAGVLLASAASNPASAMVVQRALAGDPEEAAFFPDVRDLPEGLTEATFRQTWGGLDDSRYLHAVARIDERLMTLPVFAAARAAGWRCPCIDPDGAPTE